MSKNTRAHTALAHALAYALDERLRRPVSPA
ncbi:hypothetical protein [Azospirillum melinis]